MSQITRTGDTAVFSTAGRSTGLTLLADLVQLTKPRISGMVVVTTYIGYAMSTSVTEVTTLTAALLGTMLSCMGASVVNQVAERRPDALMERTRHRPIPSGRVAPTAGLVYGLTLAGVGLAALWAGAGTLAATIGAFTFGSYVLVYTPMKRVNSTATIVGALPGALPPVIGAAAGGGRVGVEAALLFAIMFLWQLPHFLAIAWLYREDYARAAFPFLPVLDPTGRSTFRQIMLGCLALLPLGLLPTMLGVAGKVYFVGALAAGLAFLVCGVLLVATAANRYARLLFFASLVYLPVVFFLMLLDHSRG